MPPSKGCIAGLIVLGRFWLNVDCSKLGGELDVETPILFVNRVPWVPLTALDDIPKVGAFCLDNVFASEDVVSPNGWFPFETLTNWFEGLFVFPWWLILILES